MIYSSLIQKAIQLAITTHQINQKQKRKGKDVPYIVHPLSIGLILARAGANEKTIIAGILHDTIEDSVPDNKVTREIIAQEFGNMVATLVESVTEPNKDVPWEERKRVALEHVQTFSHESVLIKSADIINNLNDMFADYKRGGEAIFTRFSAPREKVVRQYLAVTRALIGRWAENPLIQDLMAVEIELHRIQALQEGHLSYIDWNMAFIRYEMIQSFANSSVAEIVIAVCERTREDISAFRRDNDVTVFQEKFTADVKEFDGIIKSIEGRSEEGTVQLLLQTHVADSLTSFVRFLDSSQ